MPKYWARCIALTGIFLFLWPSLPSADPPGTHDQPLLSAEQVRWLADKELLRIGIPQAAPPLLTRTALGALGGSEARYARYVAMKLDTGLVLEYGSLASLEKRLLEGELDAVASYSPQTRDSSLLVSSPYVSIPYVLFARSGDASIRDRYSLEHKRVALVDGDHHSYRLLQYIQQFVPVPVRSIEAGMNAVAGGQADVVMAPAPVAMRVYGERAGGGIRIAEVLREQPLQHAYAVAPDNRRLASILSAAVRAITARQHRLLQSGWEPVPHGAAREPEMSLTLAERFWLQAQPPLRMLVRQDWPPLEFHAKGEPTGLVPELARAVERQLDHPVELIQIRDWREAETLLRRGEADVAPAMPRTPGREGQFLFTRSYLRLPIVLVGHEQGRFIGDLQELESEPVGVVQGQASHEFLLTHHPNLNIRPVASLAEGLAAVQRRELDLMVTQIPGASYLIRRMGLGGLRITSITPYQYELRMAVRPDRHWLVGILNKALAWVERPGQGEIYDRWIHADLESPTDYTLVYQVALAALLIVAIFLYWNRKLSREVAVRLESEERLRQSEEALRTAKQHAESFAREAEAANRAKSEFLANMSHEIRTPMNAVMGYTELLEGQLTDPRLKGYLESIRVGSQSLLTLINDILDLSRIEAGKMRMDYQPLDLRRLLEEVRRIFAVRAQNQGLVLRLELAEDLPESMILDETRLRQVVFNLVGNAIKFTPEGEVCIRARVECGADEAGFSRCGLVLEVADTGVGIPEDQQQRIFEAFEQQTGQSDRLYGGTGLGLAISRKLVAMMGGELRVRSRPGEGSCFTIHIPDVETTASTDETPTAEAPRYHFSPARVMVVDDNAANRALVREMLGAEGLRVVQAENGREALDQMQQALPDLVLMDIRMPEMDGFTARRLMAGDPRLARIPVVALTASVMPGEVSRIQSERFQGYLRKPVSRAQLFSELARFLPHRIASSEVIPAEDGETAGTSPELTAWLEAHLGARRRALARSGDPEALDDFATEVMEVARQWRSGALHRYAQELRAALEAMELDRVEQLLAGWPTDSRTDNPG